MTDLPGRSAVTSPLSVLIVDDNRAYREAFRRNLALRGYQVQSVEDSSQALELLRESEVDVVVTDLAMRHPTEGLDLIRQVRALRPHLPVIMISAVGTFDEGAEAMRLGARQVISKSRIDAEIGSLYAAIEEAAADHARARGFLAEISDLARTETGGRGPAAGALRAMLRREDVPPEIKREAFETLSELTPEEDASAGQAAPPGGIAQGVLSEIERDLAAEIPAFSSFEAATKQNFMTAEYLFRQSRESPASVDFSRSIGFAYCFAVENEVKNRLRKRMQRFFGEAATPGIVQSLLEDNQRSISIFYQQYLLRLQKGMENEATIENYYHAFQRIMEHRGRYKPDGLKALGMTIICFGRNYSFRKMNKEIKIENPLGLKGIASDPDVLKLSSLLINLQHYRNPYIHPEISEMTKISKIRETALDCLRLISRLE